MKQNLTKMRIWNAFNDLLNRTSFSKITVEQIIEKSGVAKSTFYRHFRDKFDVLNYNSMALAERLIGQRVCSSWKEFLYYMFQGITRDIRYYEQAFRTSGQNAHSDFLFTYSFNIVEKCYLTHYNEEKLSAVDHYIIAHYCHGCVGILKDWLNNSDSVSPEQMADIFYNAMPLYLRDTWI